MIFKHRGYICVVQIWVSSVIRLVEFIAFTKLIFNVLQIAILTLAVLHSLRTSLPFLKWQNSSSQAKSSRKNRPAAAALASA